MAAPADASKRNSMGSGPESPTTVKPFDLDDDDVQETGLLSDDAHHQTPAPAPTQPTPATATSTTSEEAPPPKPPRPVSESQKNAHILKEAFPEIDLAVIKAVLVASGGRVDPAFNALLSMSDPDAVTNEPSARETAPPQPPRPAGRVPMSQMEADELYARQLAEHYDNAAYEARTQNRNADQSQRGQATGLKPNEMYDRDHSFLDDDLPVIKENLRQGFLETQTKVNSWFTQLKKRIDGEYDSEEDESQPSRHNQPGSSSRRSAEAGRRSTDYDRYDADPQVLSDDFAGIRLNPDGTTPSGRSGNPNVYRPPPKSASPRPEGRKVAFRDGHDDIDDPYNVSPKLPPKDNTSTPPSGAKASKWQPMSAVDPNPIAEHDPFSLGDSEDEKETKDKTSKDSKVDDNERLKQATADAMADSLVDDAKKSDLAK